MPLSLSDQTTDRLSPSLTLYALFSWRSSDWRSIGTLFGRFHCRRWTLHSPHFLHLHAWCSEESPAVSRYPGNRPQQWTDCHWIHETAVWTTEDLRIGNEVGELVGRDGARVSIEWSPAGSRNSPGWSYQRMFRLNRRISQLFTSLIAHTVSELFGGPSISPLGILDQARGRWIHCHPRCCTSTIYLQKVATSHCGHGSSGRGSTEDVESLAPPVAFDGQPGRCRQFHPWHLMKLDQSWLW